MDRWPQALDPDPHPEYISLNDRNRMTTITLELTPYQESRLLDALNEEVTKWRKIKIEAEDGRRPNASPEGAEYLMNDSQAVLSKVIEQIKANR